MAEPPDDATLAALPALLSQLPDRLWQCLNPGHDNVQHDGDGPLCGDCGLTRRMVRDYQERMSGVVERRVRRDIARDIAAEAEPGRFGSWDHPETALTALGIAGRIARGHG